MNSGELTLFTKVATIALTIVITLSTAMLVIGGDKVTIKNNKEAIAIHEQRLDELEQTNAAIKQNLTDIDKKLVRILNTLETHMFRSENGNGR